MNINVMKFGSVEDLKKAGFKGFMPVWMLKSAGISSDDAIANNELDGPGVYMVVRTDDLGQFSTRNSAIFTSGHNFHFEFL